MNTAVIATVAASNAAANSNAVAARKEQCIATMQGYTDAAATISDKIDYAYCVQLTVPTFSTGAVRLVVALLALGVVIGAFHMRSSGGRLSLKSVTIGGICGFLVAGVVVFMVAGAAIALGV